MKILQIAYYYPPMGGVGVQRALKFSRYLGEFGITPVVLAAADPRYVQDPALAQEIPPGLDVHRVPHSPLLAAWAARRRAAGGAAGPLPAAPPSALRSATRDQALRTWRSLQWPDAMAGWARQAAPVARRLVAEHAQRGEPIELIFASAPPVSALALAQRLGDELGLPWVADLRDLWTDNPAYDAPAWRAALDRRRERAWLASAAGVVTVTRTWAELLKQRAGGKPVAFIPNGYDEADFAAAQAPRDATRFRITHAGTFYGPRDPAGLLGGVARLLTEAPRHATRLRLRLVGNIGARFEPALAAFEQAHPGIIERVAFVPHTQAIEEMQAAEALVLVVGGAAGANHAAGAGVQGWLPGKLFEYLRARRPVLLLGDPQGEAAAIVRDCGAGLAVADHDADGIARTLATWLDKPAVLPVPTLGIESFERRALTRQLAAFLRQAAKR